MDHLRRRIVTGGERIHAGPIRRPVPNERSNWSKWCLSSEKLYWLNGIPCGLINENELNAG